MSLRFPLFIDLEGKPVIVVGGGRIGAHRARVLREFGAAVTIISPTLAVPVEGAVHLARPYACGDLQGAFLAVAATDCREVNHQVGGRPGRWESPSAWLTAGRVHLLFPRVVHRSRCHCRSQRRRRGSPQYCGGGPPHPTDTGGMGMKLRVASRESRLAVIQSQQVMETLARLHPELELELVTMKTTGDRILDRTLDQIGGKGCSSGNWTKPCGPVGRI